LWALKRGYQAWTVFSGIKGEVTTPGWRKLWWWIIISVFILIAGIIIGVWQLKVIAK
jgi:hypothetical protein